MAAATASMRQSFSTPGVAFTIRREEDLTNHIMGSGSQWVVVEFGAAWAAACQAMREDFGDLARQYPSALFLRVDIDEVPEAAEKHSILRVPSYACFWCGATEMEFSRCSARRLKEMLLNCIELGPDVAWRSLGASKVEAVQRSRIEAERQYRLKKDHSPRETTATEAVEADGYGTKHDVAMRFQDLATQWNSRTRTPSDLNDARLRAQHERELKAASGREALAWEALESAQNQFQTVEAKRRVEQSETLEASRRAQLEIEQKSRDVEELKRSLEAQKEAQRLAAEKADQRREELEQKAREDADRLERMMKFQEKQQHLFKKVREVELRGNVLFDMATGKVTVQPGRLPFKGRVLGAERKDDPVAEFEDYKAASLVLQDVGHLCAVYNTEVEVVHVDRENAAGGRYDSKKEAWCRAWAQSKAELIRDALVALNVTEQEISASSRLAEKEQTLVQIDVQAFNDTSSPSRPEAGPGPPARPTSEAEELPLDAEPALA